MVPPLKPSFRAVASSWIDACASYSCSANICLGVRHSPARLSPRSSMVVSNALGVIDFILCGIWARASPGVDTGALAYGAWRRRRDRTQSPDDPVTRLDRIDHLIDLQHGRYVDRLPGFVKFRDCILEEFVALDRIFDRFHFLAIAEPDGA